MRRQFRASQLVTKPRGAQAAGQPAPKPRAAVSPCHPPSTHSRQDSGPARGEMERDQLPPLNRRSSPGRRSRPSAHMMKKHGWRKLGRGGRREAVQRAQHCGPGMGRGEAKGHARMGLAFAGGRRAPRGGGLGGGGGGGERSGRLPRIHCTAAATSSCPLLQARQVVGDGGAGCRHVRRGEEMVGQVRERSTLHACSQGWKGRLAVRCNEARQKPAKAWLAFPLPMCAPDYFAHQRAAGVYCRLKQSLLHFQIPRRLAPRRGRRKRHCCRGRHLRGGEAGAAAGRRRRRGGRERL